MQRINSRNKKIISCILVIVIVGGLIPNGLLSIFLGMFAPLLTNAAGSEYTAPGCSFVGELYDGEDAINPLPSYMEYKEQTHYTEPKRISLTDFRKKFGEGLGFDANNAQGYMSKGYKIMICDASELYLYSQIVNNIGGVSPDEVSFYLSANFVLGNNIEYSEISVDRKYFLPIGGDSRAFTGTFDGQGFEIRDLYFDSTYAPATVAFFGVVGADAKVQNFGVYHPTINSSGNSATFTAVIASRNYGTIDSVYAITQEVSSADGSTTLLNVITSANANCAAGLVAENCSSGTISDSYFAGMLNASNPTLQNPVCAKNSGTITNCYYDSDVFKYGTTGTKIDNPDENIKALTNIDLKKADLGGMTGTNFKILRADSAGNSDKTGYKWLYPRLYGYTGSGTAADPFVISTPAQLINFPFSFEYTQRYYFAIDRCIDMNEIKPNAYKPNLDINLYTNNFSGGKWVYYNKALNNQYFNGVLSGTAENQNNCSIHHVNNLGNDSSGTPLRESHIILNLTIDTPATSNSNTDTRFTALIAGASYSNSSYNSTVKDLCFVGGEISSGDTDCMPSTNISTGYNVRTATVVASADCVDMENVHSSAAVKMGTGYQRSVMIGGLVAGGNFHFVTDCTNSGDIIGGYTEMPAENITSVNFRIGGLLGNCGAANTKNWWQFGKLTHVANYGNIYGTAIVTDSENDWKLVNGGGTLTASQGIAGISTGTLSNLTTGSLSACPTGAAIRSIDDTNRMERVANFGMIFDVPVVTDGSGKPIFTDEKGNPTSDKENGRPEPIALPSGKKIVDNQSPTYLTYIYGVGANAVCNAVNVGNIYSSAIEKCSISGIGNLWNRKSGTNYYHYLNWNKANIHMYAGAIEANGIGRKYAYKSYNSGNINLHNGVITSDQAQYNRSEYGSFSGISGFDSEDCYNDGNIYIAPSARAVYNGARSQYNGRIGVCGISPRGSVSCINAGTLTIDLEKNNFDPLPGTTNTGHSSFYPCFYMVGTGSGKSNSNYGKFDFIPNSKDSNKKVCLAISACGGGVMNVNDYNFNIISCRNYSDINIDTTEAPNCLYSLAIYGIGRNYGNKTGNIQFNNNVNFGNITFNGALADGLSIYTLGNESMLAKNNVNLGDVTITPNSRIGGNLDISDYYVNNNNEVYNTCTIQSLMNGWYDGCEVPDGLKTEEFNEIFNKLDKSRRYGKVSISGYVGGAVSYRPIRMSNTFVKDSKNNINNGEINVSNLETNYRIVVCGLSNYILSDSINYAPINISNTLCRYTDNDANTNSVVVGCSGGERNINYAPITVEHSVVMRNVNGRYFSVSGITYDQTARSCENHGTITVKNQTNATINGVEYQSPDYDDASPYDAYMTIGGIGLGSISSCVNYADINIENVKRYRVGGVYCKSNNIKRTISNCINYGDITVKNSGGQSFAGGIASCVTFGTAITNCLNFGEISVTDPTSYTRYTDPHIYLGGVAGFADNSNISSCANYGKIYYNNSKGKNTENSYENTISKTGNTTLMLEIGGIVGYDGCLNTLNCVLNYADIEVEEEQNLIVSIGGISGAANYNHNAAKNGYNLVNYGNVTAKKANTLYMGGIVGGTEVSAKGYYYGINYGTVYYNEAVTKYVGSLLGYSSGKFYMSNFVDLSTPPTGVDTYPLCPLNNNKINSAANAENYTKNESSINQTSSGFGKVEKITLDKDENTGFFSANFIFRSALIHEISEGVTNDENGLAYQDFNELSEYLQKYMVNKFGEDIKNYGAYVVMNKSSSDTRAIDTFFPGRKSVGDNENAYIVFGCTDSYKDASIIKDRDINSIYSGMVSPNSRTLQTDFNIYAQQIKQSSLPEIYDIGMQTKYRYSNTDTRFYQYFNEYKQITETHPAILSDGTVSDTILYTDLNIYVAIDDIDVNRAQKIKRDENGNLIYDENNNLVYEDIDTNGNIYLTPNIELGSKYADIQFYQGNITDTTDRLQSMNKYTDQYPNPWLTADNLAEEMVKDQWSKSYSLSGISNKSTHDQAENYAYWDLWEIAVPFTSDANINNVYTKVLGVITAEDGVHKNIVVAHVMIDKYKPFAELSSVKLTTPSDSAVTSTTANNGLRLNENQPSLTDKNKDDETQPANDVTYYYVTDNYVSDKGITLKGQNIQYHTVNTNSAANPTITVTTHNMDESGKIWAQVTRQDRLPGDDGLYNSLEWNNNAAGKRWTGSEESTTAAFVEVNPTDITYDEGQKSKGTATIYLNGANYLQPTYYGGLYRVDLYYERTKSSDQKKHFATIFFSKQHSPEKEFTVGRLVYNVINYDNDGVYTGICSNGAGQYISTDAKALTYYSHESNDKNYKNSSWWWYSRKGYMGGNVTKTERIDTDNPIYDDLPDDQKGKEISLANYATSIIVYQDEETGAFWPAIFNYDVDVMAENGTVRRYKQELVHCGPYINETRNDWNYPPIIKISSATKNGFPIISDKDGTYKGVVAGNETADAEFVCTWVSNVNGNNNVSLVYTDNQNNDGYNENKIKIMYKGINDTDVYRELSQDEINKCFDKITVDKNNKWTFKFNNSAYLGTFKIVPYMTYHTNFEGKTQVDKIELYDYNNRTQLIESEDTLNFKWTIPYSSPLIIENRPNDDSYLTELEVNNQQYTPFIIEESDIEGAESREVYIRETSENQEIVYNGYDNVRTGETRVDKFNVYTYVSKTAQTSNITIRAPYRATVMKYTGTVSDSNNYPDFSDGNWKSAASEEILLTDSEGNPIENDFKQYSFNVSYNELEDGDYTYNPSITYYKVVAEDGKTETIYKVYVVPGVRNKSTSLEIAQSSEVDNIGGEGEFNQKMKDAFNESDKLYNEILENYGQISATIKELNGSKVNAYQTKFFNSPTTGESEPYIYNLKSFAYDISVDLPAGYTYDVLVFSQALDSADILKNSQNGFDGKQLILNSSDDQILNIRIVIKRDTSQTIWGVQYIWNMDNAATDDDGYVILNKGGFFSNYVYTLKKD